MNFKRKILVIPLLLAIAVAGGVFLWLKHEPNTPVISLKSYEPDSATHIYGYSKLEAFVLPKTKDYAGASFAKPEEFKQPSKPSDGSQQVLLIHQGADHIVPDVGRIALAEVKAKSTDIARVGKIITNPKDPAYNTFLRSFQDFIDPRLPLSYSSSLEVPVAFTSANIAKDAWIANFKAKSSHVNLPQLQGQALIVFKGGNIYYFMVENVSSDWSVNQKAWQQVVNSLKVDQ
jgi:hypothetical protein